MQRSGVNLCFVLAFGILLACLVPELGLAKSIFIETIGGYDAFLVNTARSYVSAWIEATGHRVTNVRDTSAYRVRFVITEADASRPFNWWVLLFPLWPIITATTVEANVVVSLTVHDSAGSEIYANTAGGEASQFFLGDFYSRRWAKHRAFEQAFKRVIVSAYLP